MNRAGALLGAAIVLLSCPTGLFAAPAGKRAPSRRVELVAARPTDELRPFEAALRDTLAAKGLGLASKRKDAISPEDVALATTPSPEEAAAIAARVFLDFTTAGQATLFLIDPGRGRIHVRRVVLDHGFDAVARESALFIIEQSIDAILEGREIGVSREEYERSVAAPAPAVPPSPPPAPPNPTVVVVALPPAEDPVRLLLAGGYHGVALGDGHYQHAAKVVVAARLAHVEVAAAIRFAAPVSIAGDGVEARLWSGGGSMSAAARLLTAGSWSFRAGLGAGLELTRIQPAATAPDLEPKGAFWSPSPLLRPFAEVERVFGNVAISLALGAEVHPLAERYTVRTGDDTSDVFVPRRLRPEAALLAGWVF